MTPFLTQPVGGEGKRERKGKRGGGKKERFLERESTFFLDFSAIGLSNLGKAKLIPTERAKRGYWDCGVSTTPGGRSVLLLGYFLFKIP